MAICNNFLSSEYIKTDSKILWNVSFNDLQPFTVTHILYVFIIINLTPNFTDIGLKNWQYLGNFWPLKGPRGHKIAFKCKNIFVADYS